MELARSRSPRSRPVSSCSSSPATVLRMLSGSLTIPPPPQAVQASASRTGRIWRAVISERIADYGLDAALARVGMLAAYGTVPHTVVGREVELVAPAGG